ncbi:MAG: threonine synthase [Clostridiales bacterium]|nr:threonine synthase [Clostridiales bacterium]
MALLYKSTRGDSKYITASQAILKGIADDGGLYVPEAIPKIDFKLDEILNMDYKALAYRVLRLVLDDFTEDELKYCINGAYDEKFDTPLIAPLKETADCGVLELFHGKTIAFKDMALSILPYLLKTSARKNGEDRQIVILTATSGDTGKAALEGFADVEGTGIIVFFPQDGVSDVQKKQMVTQEGRNTCVVGIKGNFDDCQTAVKKAFTDKALKEELAAKGYVFSSANSINIGRLAPQIVYYFYAYAQMVKAGRVKLGEKINFVVPTGNFGNILAGYYAKNMGLPVDKLICASNENKVLYDFFKTGEYNARREFILTSSPSMDILISSNLERLLYHLSDAETVSEKMKLLSSEGDYGFTAMDSSFIGEYSTEAETFAIIKEVFEKEGYVLDTHTAVAYNSYKKYVSESGDNTPAVVVSTASPFKFAKDVLAAIDEKYKSIDPFEAVRTLSEVSGTPVPAPIKDIEKRPVLHDICIEKEAIEGFIKAKLI